MASRNHDVKTAIDRWGMADKAFVFQTLTMRHHKGQSLAELWSGLSYAWQRLNSGALSKKEVERFQQTGFIRVVEITHGKNGWHIHIHILRFLEKGLADTEVKEWSEAQYKRWSKALTDIGLDSPLRQAQDFKLTRNAQDLAKYLTKQANYGGKLDKEMTSSETKKAKLGGRKPFEILDDALANSQGLDKALWLEYETVSQGKKQTHWSNGLRDLLGINQELDDEETAAREEAISTPPVVCLTNQGIKTLSSQRRWQHEALTVAERSGVKALEIFLTEIGVEFFSSQMPVPLDTSLDDYFEFQDLLNEHQKHSGV